MIVPLPGPQPEAMREGTCARHPQPWLWEGGSAADSARAVALCLACPALGPCRAWALSLRPCHDLDMIYGGLTITERTSIRRRRQQARRAAAAAAAG